MKFVTVAIFLFALNFDDVLLEICSGNYTCLPIASCNLKDRPSDLVLLPCDDDKICCSKIKDVAKERFSVKEKPEKKGWKNVKRVPPFSENCGFISSDNKITGGQVAEIGQFPFMALLGFRGHHNYPTQYNCGGSLILHDYVLTAAHCISENVGLKLSIVKLGEHNIDTDEDCLGDGPNRICADLPKEIRVKKVIVHPGYNTTTLQNDIALVQLQYRVPETEFIKTICLPFDMEPIDDNLTTSKFSISGWGLEKPVDLHGSQSLMHATVTGWDQIKCNNSISPKVKPISERQFCANGVNSQDACNGDSGGPLFKPTKSSHGEWRNVQYGIISFGTATCGDINLPTVYTKVDRYLQWIVDQIET